MLACALNNGWFMGYLIAWGWMTASLFHILRHYLLWYYLFPIWTVAAFFMFITCAMLIFPLEPLYKTRFSMKNQVIHLYIVLFLTGLICITTTNSLRHHIHIPRDVFNAYVSFFLVPAFTIVSWPYVYLANSVRRLWFKLKHAPITPTGKIGDNENRK